MDYMELVVSLAKLALGQVSPNPAVGAVIVKEGDVIGQGYTQPPGSSHAEIMALKEAGEYARGAVMYVTLEPCCHFGRTPPCTKAIIAAGIKEVHVAMIDPNPQVNGKGLKELEKAGIKTVLGEHADDAAEIIESYVKFITTGRPFVTIKFAMSLDGKIATKSGDMKEIFESVAQLVERQADFKKGLTSSLMLPGITALTLVGAIGFYVFSLLPNMMEMLGPRMKKIPPLTAFTLEMSGWFNENFLFLAGFIILLCIGFYLYISSPKGRLNMHRILIRIPYFGRILRDTSIEMFSRVFGIMYTSSGENIDVIQIAGDASGNPYLAHQIRTVAIPLMLRFGVELGKALQETGFFPEIVISRFKTGAETGNVKATALQVADYFQMENGYAMKNLANVIEMSVTIMITLSLVFLTYLSSETANIKIK